MQRTDIPALREALAKYGDHTPLDIKFALPALLDELEELRGLTTPEVIGDKHKKGDYWQVWDGYDWRKCRWNLQWKAWQHSHGNMALHPGFTHALPLPPAPEGTDA